MEYSRTGRIEFDGGTTCNVPAKGFGTGYGSYKIENAPITRLEFDFPMSNNAAEVLTIFFGIMDAKQKGFTNLHVIGDSQIALRWVDVAAGNVKASKGSGSGTREFQKAISLLLRAAPGLRITTEWQPRQHFVDTLGH